MPKRNNSQNDYQDDMNQMLGKIDIDEYLFDNLQENQVRNQINKKRSNSPLSIIKSPLGPQQHMSEAQSYHDILSYSQQLPVLYNNQHHDQSNTYLIQTTTTYQKSQKSKMYAKNYRQKKKQRLLVLQQQNRFLKSKIDDLSFRLKQAEIQLNKYKHNHQSNTKNYQTARQSLLREIQNVLQKQEDNTEKLLEVENQLRKIKGFDSKHRMDLLNYFMSELLQNLLNDMDFYFVDSLIEKKGLWRQSDLVILTKMDLQVQEIIGREQCEKTRQMVDSLPAIVMQHFINFKTLWKDLYQDYLNIINQGTLIQTLCKSLAEHDPSNLHRQVRNYLKLQLFFEKIKYRKDLRQLRQSWFQQQQKEEKLNSKLSKKVKLIH